jgi:hypothetical protein
VIPGIIDGEGDMSDWLMRVIKAEAGRLIELAADDDELRADLRELAESILAATAPSSSVVETMEQSPTVPEGDLTDAAAADEPLRELTLGRSAPPKRDPRSESPAVFRPKSAPGELIHLENRCRRKSEAAHWVAERLRRAREGNYCVIENAPEEPEMVAWGNGLVDSFFWSEATNNAPSVDFALIDNVGGCFEAVAEALALVRAMLDEHPDKPKRLERSLPLVAEAQSGLRAAFQRLGVATDLDQLEIFEWLKVTAARHHVYIKRFMRADEVADPAGWYGLLARIESAAAAGKHSRLQELQVERIQNCLKPVQGGAANDNDWLALINVVDQIVGEGVPPSNREIRELLLPVIDELPAREDYPDSFRRVLREIDRFLAARSAPMSTAVAHEPSAEVKEAARLLGGKSIVLIGGNRRREAQESLRRALGLKDLVWIETKEHQAIDAFEPLIARSDVALVLLAIRWSSHAFGDVKQLCDRHGKLLVRLPGGYNPNQVAAQILAQSSSQLSSGTDPGAAYAHPRATSASGSRPI